MNEYQLIVVRENEFNKLLIHKIECIGDNSIRDCDTKYFQTFDHICEFEIQLANNSNNEIVIITISGKSMALYEKSKKITVARQNGFLFNQISKLTIKIYSNLSNISIYYYLKLRIPVMHRTIF